MHEGRAKGMFNGFRAFANGLTVEVCRDAEQLGWSSGRPFSQFARKADSKLGAAEAPYRFTDLAA